MDHPEAYLPNMMSPLIVQARSPSPFPSWTWRPWTFSVSHSAVHPSWGNMLSEGRMYLTRAPWLLIFPGACIVLTVLSFNLVGDVLRDRLDPHFRRTSRGCEPCCRKQIHPSLKYGISGSAFLRLQGTFFRWTE